VCMQIHQLPSLRGRKPEAIPIIAEKWLFWGLLRQRTARNDEEKVFCIQTLVFL